MTPVGPGEPEGRVPHESAEQVPDAHDTSEGLPVAVSIEVANESGSDVDETELIDVARYALGRMDVHPAAELSMTLVDMATMADLHLRWMDLPGPTDVMSFPMDEMTPGGRPDATAPGPAVLGDIVLCPEFAARAAREAGHAFEHEMALLTVHGVLHLLGFDHAEPEEEREMFGLQAELLSGWYRANEEAVRRAALAERDSRLLGRVGFLDGDEPDEPAGDGAGRPARGRRGPRG